MSGVLIKDSPETVSGNAAQRQRGSTLIYLIRCEILKLVRVPMFAVPTFVFPIMFFAMFGLPNIKGTLDGIKAGPYMMASYGAYAVMSATPNEKSATAITAYAPYDAII